METVLTVRRASVDDRDAVVEAFGAASVDEVVTAWVLEGYSGDNFLASYVPDLIDRALREDEVWLAGAGEEIWAVSVWQRVTSIERFEAEAVEARGLADKAPQVRPLRRAAAAAEVLARTHPQEFPHDYLQVIVTVPGHRGEGAGGAILADRLAASKLPAYLEASTERSAELYTRAGFVRTDTTYPLPENGPTLIPMWFRP